MRALDTSVLARWLLGDDVVQSEQAAKAVSEPAWVSQTVLLELGWVLFKALRLPREVVAGLLQQVIELETMQIENGDAMDWALARFTQGADWADMVHLASCPGDIGSFLTFDQSLARKAGDSPPIAIETL